MSTEKELLRWLNRPEKTFTENLRFAINAWKSSELSIQTKYENILAWVGENYENFNPHAGSEITELLQLKCPLPGLIPLHVKKQFVQSFIKFSLCWKNTSDRKDIELLQKLVENEMLQELYRSDYECYGQILNQLFKRYRKYLLSYDGALLQNYETDFFISIINALKNHSKKVANVSEFGTVFSLHIIQALVELLITFQSKGMRFISHLAEIEKTIYNDNRTVGIIGRFKQFPLHVCLMTVECTIINYKGGKDFFQMLLKTIFKSLKYLKNSGDGKLLLVILSYCLEMFRKYDILLHFPIESGSNTLELLGENIVAYVEEFYSSHLHEVLMLLCAALRLNPLILEKHIFNISTSMIIAEKNNIYEQDMYEEFVVLVIDMFRKLRHVEKSLKDLFKSLRKVLKNQKLNEKKLKRKRHNTESLNDISRKTKEIKLEVNGEIKEYSFESEESDFFLKVLIDDMPKSCKAKAITSNKSTNCYLPNFLSIWPSSTVGSAFSKLIFNQMSKPSLVIWKMILYEFKEIIEAVLLLEPFPQQLDENTLFLIDFYTSLCCNYFVGCKICENAGKLWKEIETNHALTQTVLQKFGQMLLSLEHSNRIMNAFLECVYFSTQFDLLFWYYQPDHISMEEKFSNNMESLHNFISADEWELIQQRVINFGEVECKFKINRLLVQRVKAKMLFKEHKKNVNCQKLFISPLTNDMEQYKIFFADQGIRWFLANIHKDEKMEICEKIIENLNIEQLGNVVEDIEALELIAIKLYQKLGECFDATGNNSILSAVDFAELNSSIPIKNNIKIIANLINQKDVDYTIRKYDEDRIKKILSIMKQLQIGFVNMQCKIIVLMLQLGLCLDLRATQNEKLSTHAFDIFADILHFGEFFNILKYVPIENLLRIVPPDSSRELYTFIFSTLKTEAQVAKKFLKAILNVLEGYQNQSELCDDHFQLLLNTLDTINCIFKPSDEIFNRALKMYSSHINAFFANESNRDHEKAKHFVRKTLAGFPVYIKFVLSKTKTSEDKIDTDISNVCKIYFSYSADNHDEHAINLMSVVLKNHLILNVAPEEIESVLSKHWKQVITDFKAEQLESMAAKSAIEIIINYKTDDGFSTILQEISEEDITKTCRLLSLIAQCCLTSIKSAIFKENFKLIILNIILRLKKDQQGQFINHEYLLSILDCQRALCENKTITMSTDVIDDIMAFLMDINMKKFLVGDTNSNMFKTLHLAISELMITLIKHHYVFLMDRVPQFMHIFKDLMQAIVWYKGDREKNTTLLAEEVDGLVELALKLESLMHLISEHDVEVKRVAPFILCFAINLMISDKRLGTVYSKVKLHIENICYDLISIADHRSGEFILRCSNDAARQVYEGLYRTYGEYHKFKGKI